MYTVSYEDDKIKVVDTSGNQVNGDEVNARVAASNVAQRTSDNELKNNRASSDENVMAAFEGTKNDTGDGYVDKNGNAVTTIKDLGATDDQVKAIETYNQAGQDYKNAITDLTSLLNIKTIDSVGDFATALKNNELSATPLIDALLSGIMSDTDENKTLALKEVSSLSDLTKLETIGVAKKSKNAGVQEGTEAEELLKLSNNYETVSEEAKEAAAAQEEYEAVVSEVSDAQTEYNKVLKESPNDEKALSKASTELAKAQEKQAKAAKDLAGRNAKLKGKMLLEE